MEKRIDRLRRECDEAERNYNEVAARVPSAENWQLDELQDAWHAALRAVWDEEDLV